MGSRFIKVGLLVLAVLVTVGCAARRAAVSEKERRLTDREFVSEALEKLRVAYEDEKLRRFMSQVSRDYRSDYEGLEERLEGTFDDYDNISLSIVIDKILVGETVVVVHCHWDKSWLDVSTYTHQKDSGETVLTFAKRGRRLKLLDMTGDQLF